VVAPSSAWQQQASSPARSSAASFISLSTGQVRSAEGGAGAVLCVCVCGASVAVLVWLWVGNSYCVCALLRHTRRRRVFV
jgi:hypothetical protein